MIILSLEEIRGTFGDIYQETLLLLEKFLYVNCEK
jgi:hypothetical protein